MDKKSLKQFGDTHLGIEVNNRVESPWRVSRFNYKIVYRFAIPRGSRTHSGFMSVEMN